MPRPISAKKPVFAPITPLVYFEMDERNGTVPKLPRGIANPYFIVKEAFGFAEALVAGGLAVLEVTLRTSAALDVIAEMKKVPGAIVGAGTIVDIPGLESAIAAGAEFIVSPGLTESLGKAAVAKGTPFLPGIANAGDI